MKIKMSYYSFNSMIVRLKAFLKRPICPDIPRFNSMIVRLKEYKFLGVEPNIFVSIL